MMIISLKTTIPIILFIATILLLIRTFFTKEKESNLIKCPDCKHKVSKNAKTCPKCNREMDMPLEDINASAKQEAMKKKYTMQITLLNILELIIGISIVFIFEWVDEFIPQLITLLSLIINTINLIIFNIKEHKKRKEYKVRISIISIPAILCGLIFSVYYTFYIFYRTELTYEADLREIMYLEKYDVDEAEDLLDSIYDALEIRDDLNCVELYGIWETDGLDNTYNINIKETCTSYYLPVNSLRMEVYEDDETEVKRIYWQFNDTIQIDYFADGKQIPEFYYIYHASIYDEEPAGNIKTRFESQIKENIQSPSTAIFTYNNFHYFKEQNRFAFSGWVESQNTYGAMIKKEFLITILPCKDNCEYGELDYKWEWLN